LQVLDKAGNLAIENTLAYLAYYGKKNLTLAFGADVIKTFFLHH
jgi:hypothetical protein